MDHLDLPSVEDWQQRQDWFQSHIFKYEDDFQGSYLIGEQATALLFEVQCCFCAGAWAAVIILAFTVAEANLSETDASGTRKRAVELLRQNGLEQELDALRKRRNSLIHARRDDAAITLDNQYDDREQLEDEARDAIRLMFKAFYSQVGT